MYRNVHTVVYRKTRTRWFIVQQKEMWDEEGDKYFKTAFQKKMANENPFASEFPQQDIQIPRTHETYTTTSPGLQTAEHDPLII